MHAGDCAGPQGMSIVQAGAPLRPPASAAAAAQPLRALPLPPAQPVSQAQASTPASAQLPASVPLQPAPAHSTPAATPQPGPQQPSVQQQPAATPGLNIATAQAPVPNQATPPSSSGSAAPAPPSTSASALAQQWLGAGTGSAGAAAHATAAARPGGLASLIAPGQHAAALASPSLPGLGQAPQSRGPSPGLAPPSLLAHARPQQLPASMGHPMQRPAFAGGEQPPC
jgi:hypothetical protein